MLRASINDITFDVIDESYKVDVHGLRRTLTIFVSSLAIVRRWAGDAAICHQVGRRLSTNQ